jgi:NADH-quinone oxidoreductase subunit N
MLSIILLSVSGIASLFMGFNKSRALLMPAVLLFLLVALAVNLLDWNSPFTLSSVYNNNMMTVDKVSIAFSAVLILTTLLVIPFSQNYIDKPQAQPAEYYAILLFSLVGAIMMTCYDNLLMLFIGVEILSISMYVLAGSDKRNLRSTEAALKYFLMGAFMTGFLLFGIAMLYGATGGFSISNIATYVTSNAANTSMISPLLYIGLVLVLIGVLFKVSAAPFHFWTPDVYEGAPSLFTAYMSTIVKIAGFAALYRLLSVSFTGVYDFWVLTIAIVSLLTLVVGNVTAVYQKSFKRMMAYSGISHAGYLLIAVVAFKDASQNAILFYSLAYAISTIAAFGVFILVADKTGSEDFTAFNGLAKNNPLLALVMTVAMCSLAGIPLTGGFFGKFLIFSSAFERGGFNWLLIGAILMSAVSIYYYFKVVIAMYIRENNTENTTQNIALTPLQQIALLLCTFLTLLLGIVPSLVVNLL